MHDRFKRGNGRKADPPKKRQVVLGLPTVSGALRSSIGFELYRAAVISCDPRSPWLIEPSILPYCKPIELARNLIAKHFIEETKAEYLVFIDEDMDPPENWPDLLGAGDIVSGLTWMWKPDAPAPARLQFNQFDATPSGGSTTIYPKSMTEPYRCDMVGMACVAIHRRVFERIGTQPFECLREPDGRILSGEDIVFCQKARAAGFEITINPRVIFEHWKTCGLRSVFQMATGMAHTAMNVVRAEARASDSMLDALPS